MKKLIVAIIATFGICLSNVEAKINIPEKTNHEKVKVYLFWSDTCHNCHNLIKYFSNKYDKYEEYFEIVTYQVNNDVNNAKLSNLIATDVGEDPGYIPLVIIGNTYHVLGWQNSLGETIIKEALKAYEDNNYKDIVAKKITDNKLSVTEKSFTDACSIANISCNGASKGTKTNILIIGTVMSVLALGFTGIVILSKKNRD